MAPNLDINSILKQFNILSSGNSSDKDTAIKELIGNGSNLAGSIYNNDTDKLPQEILKLAKTAASLFDLGTNSASEASQEVAQQNQDIAAANDTSNDIFASVNSRLQNILDNCTSTEASIREALGQIQALGGDIEELQAKLEEKIKELDSQKEILNKENSTPAQRKEAIATILKIAGEIDELFAQVGEYQSELEDQQNIATEESENLETQTEDLENVVQEGAEDITEVTEETNDITENAVEMQVDAGTKIAVGGEQKVFAAELAAGSWGTASALAAQHATAGGDKIAAGGIKQAGAATGFAQTATLLGSILTKVADFANNANAIGQYTSEVANLVGSFNSTLEPMIQSIGSWAGIASANEELKSYTTDYASQIGMSDEQIAKLGSEDENNEETEGSNLTFKEYTFDTNTFREAFKIEQ